MPIFAILLALVMATSGARAADVPELAVRWSLETPGQLPQAIVIDPRDQGLLYVALKSGGVAAWMGDGQTAPQTLAVVSTAALGGLDAMSLALVDGRLYVALGDFFAANGSRAGLAILDVGDPRQLRVLGLWTAGAITKGAAAVVVEGRYAYLGAMNEGVKIFDISDPSAPRLISTFQPDPNYPRRNPTAVQYPNARGLAIVGHRLFVADDAGGLRVVDVGAPSAPREIGRYSNSRMGSKQQAYNNLVVDGNRVYAAVDYAGLEILDITNVASIRQLGWWNPWRAETLGNIWFNSAGHTNQIAYDATRRLVYLSAGDSELQVVDVANPFVPRLAAEHGEIRNNLGVWGLTLGESEVYLTYMQAVVPFVGTWAGVRAVERMR